MSDRIFEVTPQIRQYTELARRHDTIPSELYAKNNVMRGLRDLNGNGVITGLTSISEVCAKEIVDGKRIPCPGELYYRGYNVKDLIHGAAAEGRFVFEEAAYLLLNGELPNERELADFTAELSSRRTLPANFTRDVIMKAPTRDVMVNLAKSVLALYSYDVNPTDISLENVMRQC
ncbi:MAG: citrate synthase, partial [Lachnospiraceae bacterium]|nr:citrate synthase [Lachnospiraceae bacterium]